MDERLVKLDQIYNEAVQQAAVFYNNTMQEMNALREWKEIYDDAARQAMELYDFSIQQAQEIYDNAVQQTRAQRKRVLELEQATTRCREDPRVGKSITPWYPP